MKTIKTNKITENDTLTILNYPGSKKRLLNFINNTIANILPKGKTVFDIFCGTSAVGYSLKNNYRILSNDSEIFCYAMAKALVGNNTKFNFSSIEKSFFEIYNTNVNTLYSAFPEVENEEMFIVMKDIPALVNFYKTFTTVSQLGYEERNIASDYSLFTTYYSNSYFGLRQSIEIDSLRCAIEHYKNTENYYVLLCCLYYAMKEVVFSKDGHMAQPLNIEKNSSVLLKRRQKSIFNYFNDKVAEFSNSNFVINNYTNSCYNYNLSDVLAKGLIDDADLVYADPPYTDMQYSRYFHLLETVTKYDYPEISQSKGKVSTGLYRSERYQSPLSQHANAKRELEKLIEYCASKKKKLIFSYAYPINTETDKKDRYTMSIDDLVGLFEKHFGKKDTTVLSVDFEHCNNRNSISKKVYEYLIVGNPSCSTNKHEEESTSPEIIEKTIAEINQTIGTNNSAIYNSHLYWSQKPYNICDILLKNLSHPGDVICDPFMGSGVTIIQSLANEGLRRPIGVEVNDYPIFLLKTLLGKHDVLDFMMEANILKNELSDIEDLLYSSTCPHCGHKVKIEKSKFCYSSSGKKQLEMVYAHCKKCKKSITSCSETDCLNFSRYDNEKFYNFENIDLIPDSRIAVKENQTLHDIFTSRNIKAIDSILALIKNKKYYQLYIYSLIGVMHLCKITDPKSSSQWPLWTPNHDCIEKNAITLFIKSVEKTINALFAVKEKLYENRQEVNSFAQLQDGSYYVIKNGVQFLDEESLPSDSVDLVITDPPYMGQVIYSEYMQLYKPFLKTEIEYEKEIIVIKTKDRTKTEGDYFNDMNKAFAQISRILKEGKYLCLYFHDASLKNWNKLISMLENNNFIFTGITHVNKGKATLKNIVSPKKSMNGDAILFFQKKSISCTAKTEYSDEDLINIAKQIIVNNNGKATTAQLYDNGVLAYLIKNKALSYYSKKYADLTELFSKYFNWIEAGGYWTVNDN